MDATHQTLHALHRESLNSRLRAALSTMENLSREERRIIETCVRTGSDAELVKHVRRYSYELAAAYDHPRTQTQE